MDQVTTASGKGSLQLDITSGTEQSSSEKMTFVDAIHACSGRRMSLLSPSDKRKLTSLQLGPNCQALTVRVPHILEHVPYLNSSLYLLLIQMKTISQFSKSIIQHGLEFFHIPCIEKNMINYRHKRSILRFPATHTIVVFMQVSFTVLFQVGSHYKILAANGKMGATKLKQWPSVD